MDGMCRSCGASTLNALAGIYDPCCREKGISVLDMGLVRSVHVEGAVLLRP